MPTKTSTAPALEQPDWQDSATRSKVLRLVFQQHDRDSLPVHPTVTPTYCLETVARYRVDFRDRPDGKGRILVSARVVARVAAPDLELVECTLSDYR